MRRYDEPIKVRAELVETAVGDELRPAQFIWKQRLWRVIEVEQRWYESAEWWSSPGGEEVAEAHIWRVLASSGRSSLPNVYELARGVKASGDAEWRLRSVVD